MSTLERMRDATARVERHDGSSLHDTFIAEMCDEADRMVEEANTAWRRSFSQISDGHALTFEAVRLVNRQRAQRWHPGFPDDETWSGGDWSNAMCGEAGEAANVVKKLRRHETGLHGNGDPTEDELRSMLAHEIADVFLYLDLLASKYGIDLPTAVVEKFNIVSERQGFPERL